MKKSVGQQWATLQSRLSAKKSGSAEPAAKRKQIKPKRIDLTTIDRPDDPLFTAVKPDVKRIDDTDPDFKPIRSNAVNAAPDRTFEMKRALDRPELKYVTPGKPEVIDDTAIIPVIDDFGLIQTELNADTAPDDAAHNIPDQIAASAIDDLGAAENDQSGSLAKSLDATSIQSVFRPSDGSMSVGAQSPVIRNGTLQQTEHEPTASALSKWFPGISQLVDGFRKQRKVDRSIRRNSRERVYRLKGYTTIAKVNRKRQSEERQRLLRRLLIGIIAILTLFLLFQIYNPVKDLSEWYRVLGVKSFNDLTIQSTTSPTTFQTIIGTQTGTQTTTTVKTTTATTKATTTVKR